MQKIGISLYPEKSNFDEDARYLAKAIKLGYTRIFMNMLLIDPDHSIEIIEKYKKTINYAKQLNSNVEIILDISPMIFEILGIDLKELKLFSDIGVDGLRLDMGFSGKEEAQMTHNPYNLKIELNMSRYSHYLDRIMDFHPNIKNLIGCHNFYPQEFTGLSLSHFDKCTKKFTDYGLRTAAFITSQTAEIGPWELQN